MRFKISAIGKNISNNLPTAYYISFGPADSVLKLLSLCSAQISNPWAFVVGFNIIRRSKHHRRRWTEIAVDRGQMKQWDLGATIRVPVASAFVLFSQGNIIERSITVLADCSRRAFLVISGG